MILIYHFVSKLTFAKYAFCERSITCAKASLKAMNVCVDSGTFFHPACPCPLSFKSSVVSIDARLNSVTKDRKSLNDFSILFYGKGEKVNE